MQNGIKCLLNALKHVASTNFVLTLLGSLLDAFHINLFIMWVSSTRLLPERILLYYECRQVCHLNDVKYNF